MSVHQYSSCKLPTLYGQFELIIFRTENEEEIAVMVSENLALDKAPFVRVHSQCFTGEVLGSMKCDCREQLQYALEKIGTLEEGGIVIYLPQEGRGIGLGNKVKAYKLQEGGVDTLDANHQLGFEGDLRDFKMAADILNLLGVKRVKFNTNNPEKIQAIIDGGIEIDEVLPSIGNENEYNHAYLKTKAERMGHIQLKGIPLNVVSCDRDKKA